jgi:hypothetical protein
VKINIIFQDLHVWFVLIHAKTVLLQLHVFHALIQSIDKLHANVLAILGMTALIATYVPIHVLPANLQFPNVLLALLP